LTVLTAAPARAIRRGAKSPAIGIRRGSRNPPRSRRIPNCSTARRMTLTWKKCLAIAKDFDHVIINTSTPSLKNDCKVAEAIKAQKPDTKIGFVGAHTMVLPTETLKASPAIDWVGRKEFDFTCKEVAEDRDLSTIAGFPTRTRTAKSSTIPSAR
jgi:hypothetical protein